MTEHSDPGDDPGGDHSADRNSGGPVAPPDRATAPDADVVLRLPRGLRDDLRQPLGPVTDDVEAVLASAGTPLVTVGDIVTHRVEEAGGVPQAAVVDGRTQRGAVEPSVRAAIGDGRRRIAATNPAGTLAASLLRGLVAAFDGRPAVVTVDGEEDLATLPAIVAVPDGASVCYGQPGEGMVHVTVDPVARDRARDLLGRMAGDHDRLWRLLERD